VLRKLCNGAAGVISRLIAENNSANHHSFQPLFTKFSKKFFMKSSKHAYSSSGQSRSRLFLGGGLLIFSVIAAGFWFASKGQAKAETKKPIRLRQCLN